MDEGKWWSEDMDRTIIKLWGTISTELIAERMSTATRTLTANSVRNRILRLRDKGVDIPRFRARRDVESKWPAEMDAVLLANKGQQSAGQLAKQLGITRSAVIGRIFRLRKKGHDIPLNKAGGANTVSRWTKEMDDYLRTHRTEPTEEIAETLSTPDRPVSEHAVRARRKRLGLAKPREKSSRKPPKIEPTIIATPPLNIPFAELKRGQCKYPVTDDAPFLFCGNPQRPDSSYCAHCHALCHTEYRPQLRNVSGLNSAVFKKYNGPLSPVSVVLRHPSTSQTRTPCNFSVKPTSTAA